MIAGTVLENILVAILNEVGIPALLQWLIARTPQAQAQAILDAEYKSVATAAELEAQAALGNKP